jgi:hypothetical protein
MAAPARPTDEDYADAVRGVLLGLVTGEDLDSITGRLGQLHLPKNTFPADVLLELAAEAIAESGVDRNGIRRSATRRRTKTISTPSQDARASQSISRMNPPFISGNALPPS